MPRYSICVTHYNNYPTVRDSLESVLGQIDDTFEVIVVDNQSSDGSEKILKDYQEKGRIKLLTMKCSRGHGRQAALEYSTAPYIISHIDMDDVYWPKLRDLIDFYHSRCEGKVMVAVSKPGDWTQNVTIGPRELIANIGGWRDLQFADDWDLWSRAAVSSNYNWTVFPLSERHGERRSRSGFQKTLRFRFRKYRDAMRLGREVFKDEDDVSASQTFARFLARVSLVAYPSPLRHTNSSFKAADPAYFVS